MQLKNNLSTKWLTKKKPFISRLNFEKNYDTPLCVSDSNSVVREEVLRELSLAENIPLILDDFIDNKGEDDVIAQVDRYGLPYNTVISKKTGIVRVSPYYSDEWVKTFYNKFYRPLYTNDQEFSKNDVFQDQMSRGNFYFSFIGDNINQSDSILEVGCGMGGVLFPFKLRDFTVKGIDYGEEFVSRGKEFGLDLSNDDIEDLISSGKQFDLIILSHLLEHVVDLNTFLSKIRKLLTFKGRLFIAVPGIKNIHKAYNGDLLRYLQNAHAWHFSQNTLEAALVCNGFEILKSDEEINCLAQKVDGVTSKIKENLLTSEYEDVKRYLLDTEAVFQEKANVIDKSNKPFLDISVRDLWLFKILIKIKKLLK